MSMKMSAPSLDAFPRFSSHQRPQHRWQAELSHNALKQNAGKKVFKIKCHSISKKNRNFSELHYERPMGH